MDINGTHLSLRKATQWTTKKPIPKNPSGSPHWGESGLTVMTINSSTIPTNQQRQDSWLENQNHFLIGNIHLQMDSTGGFQNGYVGFSGVYEHHHLYLQCLDLHLFHSYPHFIHFHPHPRPPLHHDTQLILTAYSTSSPTNDVHHRQDHDHDIAIGVLTGVRQDLKHHPRGTQQLNQVIFWLESSSYSCQGYLGGILGGYWGILGGSWGSSS